MIEDKKLQERIDLVRKALGDYWSDQISDQEIIDAFDWYSDSVVADVLIENHKEAKHEN